MNGLRLLQRAVAERSEPEHEDSLLLAAVQRELAEHRKVVATLKLQETMLKARIGTRG
jgi:hypothetical protein